MARGKSGRIILEVEPEVKKEIYLMLDRRGQTLKDWFLQAAGADLLNDIQMSLDLEHGACHGQPVHDNRGGV